MPRRPRLSLPDIPMHIVQRGHNREACFFANEDYQFYLDQLQILLPKSGCKLHAYVLMTNHVHLLLTPQSETSSGQLMKHLSQRYVQYVNRTYQRSGTLWEGRYRSSLVQNENYLLACYRYIELNPVRASMVARPADYAWSSYAVNGEGAAQRQLTDDRGKRIADLVTPHLEYRRLDKDAQARALAYRALFKSQLDSTLVDTITRNVLAGNALGTARFVAKIEAMTGRRVSAGQAGRPRVVEG